MTVKTESTFADSDIEKRILSGNIEIAETTINSLEKEVDKKSFVDCLLRNRLINLISLKSPPDEIIALLSLAFSLARKDLCSKALLASLLGDILDTSTVEQCELIFGFIEDHLVDWKKKEFDLCRNPVLRLCNDLLRRLSRTTHTVFCGRIFVFLARLLPLNEKSGLNSIGLFNTENVTKFDTVEDTSIHSADGRSSGQKLADDSTMEVEEGEMDDESKADSSVLVDYNLYCKFWQLQSFFSSPLTCYDKFNWKKFAHNATEVMNAFASHKLTESQASTSTIRRSDLHSMELDEKSTVDANTPTDSDHRSYFAKYLTSQKLLQLQLCDNNFRRYVLTQFLILFQYLTADVRFKDKKVHVLHDDQAKFVKESTAKCYNLLAQTYPEGAKFAKAIEHILEREEIRNAWKNAGCEDFLSKIESEKVIGMKRRAKEKYSTNPLNMGNPVLTKLFSACPNNFEACKAPEREFIPDLEAFIEEPLEQMDPASQIDDEYKIVSNENFQWRAMRLTLLKSPHFFNQPNANVAIFNRPPDALEKLFADIAKDVPKYNKYVDIYKEKMAQRAEAARKAKEAEQTTATKGQTEGAKSSDVQDTIGDSALDSECINLRAENLDDLPISQSVQSDVDTHLISSHHIEKLSKLIKNGWIKLAESLELYNSRENLNTLKKDDPVEVCSVILTTWTEKEGKKATVKKMRNILLTADLYNEEVAAVLNKVDENENTSSVKDSQNSGDEPMDE